MAGKLGRLPRDMTRRALTLEHYLTGALPPAPRDVDRATMVTASAQPWPMYGNDRIGDCTCAAMGHMVQAWTSYAGKPMVTVPESQIITMYSAVSGYDPSTGANDNGATMQSVLDYMKATGLTDDQGQVHKIAAYAAFADPLNHPLVKDVLNTFGTVYVGINCPQSALDQYDAGQIWSFAPGSPIEGGHAIDLQRVAGGGMGVLHYITWGREQRTTLGFHRHYVEEAWCVVTEDWIGANGTTCEGLDLNQLLTDAGYVT